MKNFLAHTLQEIKNVQVYPTKQLIKSKLKAQIVETKNHKKFGTIKSFFAISNDVGYSNFTTPLYRDFQTPLDTVDEKRKEDGWKKC